MAMATLRTLPSISPLLEPPRGGPISSKRRVPFNCSSKQCLKLGALVTTKALIQGLSEEVRLGGEDFGKVEVVESGEGLGFLERFVKENARELVLGSLVFALVCLPDEHALALGPGGPVMEEFWDNVRRYGFYFFTVVSGGLYSLAKPLLDLLKNPSTQILVLIAVIGTLYLVYLTVSTMLGLNDFVYEYAQ